MEAVMGSVSGKNVLVVLTTRFGKSLIHASMQLAFDILHAAHGSVVVMITPLTSI